MSDIAAVILAAGRGTRFAAAEPDAAKLVADLHGKALVRHVAEAALASSARPVIVVTGHARDKIEAALDGLPLTFVHNADYAAGLAGSLRTGVARIPRAAAGAVVLLGDMPLVTAALINALAHAFAMAAGADAVVPITEGRRGNPVLLARSLFPAIAELAGDEGARILLQARGISVLELAVPGEAAAADIDTPEALERLRRAPINPGAAGSATS